VKGEERRKGKREKLQVESLRLTPRPVSNSKEKIEGGISNKSHGLDDVTLDLPKQPKDPPFDLGIKYANFEPKAT